MDEKFPFDFFRANAAAVIVNSKGQVLAFERSDTKNAWQFPQGGVEYDEDPIRSIYREILEETGIDPQNDLILVSEYPEWLTYEFPKGNRPRGWSRGQSQKWFLFKTKDDNVNPDMSRAESPEFVNWRWAEIDEIVENMIWFKKPVYEKIGAWAKSLLPRIINQ